MYTAADTRYNSMPYKAAGLSGLKLPLISLGLWQNFGQDAAKDRMRKILHFAFDAGITHFDLANNYGPPVGAAEKNFGEFLKSDFAPYRDEIIISTKAGYPMWPGPYGNWGGKKYLLASLDQSLTRLGVDYVDIFYHHRPDPETPMEETAEALIQMLKQGKTLYIGLSNYTGPQTLAMSKIFRAQGYRILINQPRYHMFDRWIEHDLKDILMKEGIGTIAFSPLAQGLLSEKYINGIPADSRYGQRLANKEIKNVPFTDEQIAKVRKLAQIAQDRGQSLPQMALAWVLKMGNLTSVLVGVSNADQLRDNLKALDKLSFSEDELQAIESILA